MAGSDAKAMAMTVIENSFLFIGEGVYYRRPEEWDSSGLRIVD
jgi:hypothetical protein